MAVAVWLWLCGDIATAAEDVVLSWLVDDGVPKRGHRVNLLRPEWRVCGVAAGAHKHMESMYIALFADEFSPSESG